MPGSATASPSPTLAKTSSFVASAGGAGVTRITARFLGSHILTRSCKADTILKRQ